MRQIISRYIKAPLSFRLSALQLSASRLLAFSPKNLSLFIGRMLAGSVLATACAQAATVSVSNYPLHLLSNEVTKGTPAATRLLQPGDVGHHGSLSPSDIKTIQNSEFVVWFGEPLERNLAATLTSAPNAISLLDFKAFKRYPIRDVRAMPINNKLDKNSLDPHIWMDPTNAKAIVRALGVIHTHANPQYKARYQANVADFEKRFDQAVQVAKQRRQIPKPARQYWAYHDAFQYLEPALEIRLAGTLTTDHHLPPKASQFRWLQQHRPNPTMCLAAQGPVATGITKKLAPVKVTIQLEDMSSADDFVSAWSQMANGLLDCIAS
ncbi:MAG: zinc ABC transporter substrate-binding protein [Psychrobacter sp.]|nr:zinc ABC transporter substrate-binding protein [Psychrobacter sp.]